MPKAVTLHEDVVTLADTAVTPLYATPTQCLWAEVLQHPDYGDVKISLGAASTPTVTREVDMPLVASTGADGNPLYDLATVNVQAAAGGNKVLVRYATILNPYP